MLGKVYVILLAIKVIEIKKGRKMKISTIFLIILFMTIVVQAVESDDNNWEVIRQKWIACENATTPEEAEALLVEYQHYINSLSENQLLIAARHCATEIQQRISPEHWNQALWALGFFYQDYPSKTNSLENISPLLTDLRNSSLPPFWRYSIMQFLGVEWRGKIDIKTEQNLNAAIAMKEIVTDISEPKLLRIKAAEMSTNLLRDVHRSNFEDDPKFKKNVENGQQYRDVVNGIKEGQLIPAKETIERNIFIEAAIAESIEAQIQILTEPNLPANLGVDLLGNLTNLRDYDELGQIKYAVNNASRNYKNYDESLWRYLVRISMIYFENEEAESILSQMINDAKSKHEKEYTLPELKKGLDKGEIKRQPYIHGGALIKVP